MALPFADDLAAILNVDEFATAATFTRASGGSSTVNGIFDNETVPVDSGGYAPVHEEQPRFTCGTQDITGIIEGDAFTILAVDYTVRAWVHDGTGVTVVQLEKVENDDGLAPTPVEEDYGTIIDPADEQIDLGV